MFKIDQHIEDIEKYFEKIKAKNTILSQKYDETQKSLEERNNTVHSLLKYLQDLNTTNNDGQHKYLKKRIYELENEKESLLKKIEKYKSIKSENNELKEKNDELNNFIYNNYKGIKIDSIKDAMNVLEIEDMPSNKDQFEKLYRNLIKKWHPNNYNSHKIKSILATMITADINNARDYLKNIFK